MLSLAKRERVAVTRVILHRHAKDLENWLKNCLSTSDVECVLELCNNTYANEFRHFKSDINESLLPSRQRCAETIHFIVYPRNGLY